MKNKPLLPADTVLDNLNVLAPREEEEAIERFLKSSPQIEHCRRQRIRLLESQTNLRISFVCWQLAFRSACPEYREKDPTEWHEFEKEIQAHHRSVDEIMRCIISISNAWGKDVVQHYDWKSVGVHNCNRLRALSKKLPRWPMASKLLNYAILERVRRTDKRTPEVQDQASPIERWDLIYASNLPKDKEPLDLSQLPEGYGLDRYGLIVRERFAARRPSPSSQQHRTTLHAGDVSPQLRCASNGLASAATNASSSQTSRVKTTHLSSSKRATTPAGLTPPASPEHHQVSGDNENRGVHDSDDRNGSSAASTSHPPTLAPVLSSSGATALPSSEATELSSFEAIALQTTPVPSDSAALSRDTDQSLPNAVARSAPTNGSRAGCLQLDVDVEEVLGK